MNNFWNGKNAKEIISFRKVAEFWSSFSLSLNIVKENTKFDALEYKSKEIIRDRLSSEGCRNFDWLYLLFNFSDFLTEGLQESIGLFFLAFQFF